MKSGLLILKVLLGDNKLLRPASMSPFKGHCKIQ